MTDINYIHRLSDFLMILGILASVPSFGITLAFGPISSIIWILKGKYYVDTKDMVIFIALASTPWTAFLLSYLVAPEYFINFWTETK